MKEKMEKWNEDTDQIVEKAEQEGSVIKATEKVKVENPVNGRSTLTEDQETSTITKKNKVDGEWEVPDEDRAIDK